MPKAKPNVHIALAEILLRRSLTSGELLRELIRLGCDPMRDSALTARVRDLRKPRYGSYNLRCQCVVSGTGDKRRYEYRIV